MVVGRTFTRINPFRRRAIRNGRTADLYRALCGRAAAIICF
ncbi:hypothetical protein V5F53_11715 [Xanthobacter sp. V4C-4]